MLRINCEGIGGGVQGGIGETRVEDNLMHDDGGLDHGDSSERGESGWVLDAFLETSLQYLLTNRCRITGEVKDDSKVSGGSIWKDEIAIEGDGKPTGETVFRER